MTQSDIINNNFSKAFECIKCSNAYDTGEVLSEEKLFKQISERKHSTFDLSKFTVVGSPTIMDDGVVSGISASNYLTFPLNINPQNTLKIQIEGVHGDTQTSAGTLFHISDGTTSLTLYRNRSSKMSGEVGSTSKTYLGDSAVTTNGARYKYVVSFDIVTNKYSYLYYENDVLITQKDNILISVLANMNWSNITIGNIGQQYSPLNGSIDLKHFSITVDGKEVFSGNKTGLDVINDIEIPYTLSKTGSKIVDVAYRDRVIDLYEQEGQAGYYTIDEENQNFTLPMGEIYGMVEGKADKKEIYSKLTNCLLEVPQRIKYTLVDGTLTIKAGSVVIIPYGTEDLTAQYPIGATFIKDNFKVYNTQFEDGKFFVWVELVNDIIDTGTWGTAESGAVYINSPEGVVTHIGLARFTSGDTAPTDTRYWYDTSLNYSKYFINGASSGSGCSFPLMIVSLPGDDTTSVTSINQVFNGMGYIGSTVWVDKGVKGLIPNGRNEEGSLNNIRWTNDELIFRTFPNTINASNGKLIFDLVGTDYDSHLRYFGSDTYLDDDTNTWVTTGAGILKTGLYLSLGDISINAGVISNFQPKLPSKVVDTSSLTECIAVVETYQNGSSWYRVYSDGWCEQGGHYTHNNVETTVTTTFIKPFININYNLQITKELGSSAASGIDYQFISSYVASSKTTSQFQVRMTGANRLNGYDWQASGYIR